jgi:putative ABC transport system substrate-binding protein
VKWREFITLLGGAAAPWPLKAGAQQAERARRIGILISTSEGDADNKARLAGKHGAFDSNGPRQPSGLLWLVSVSFQRLG